MRSLYMLSEYENVKAGRPVEHPNQFQQGPGIFYTSHFCLYSSFLANESLSLILASFKCRSYPAFCSNATNPLVSGDAAALGIFQDVCGRTTMLDLLVNDTSGIAAMMTGNAGPRVDFGQKVKDAVAALKEACPADHAAFGMRA